MNKVYFRLAHFVSVPPATADQLRTDPSTVAALLDRNREQTSIDHYWHGMQYLLAGRAQGVRGPLAWFTSGGETLGRTSAGPVRYLSPEQVKKLSAILDETEPDDLGDDVYDEAAMDTAGVHPGRWVRDGETFDPLGTMRELYAYLRDFLARQASAGNGVAITMTLEPAPEDEDDNEMADATPRAEEPEPQRQPGAVILTGANGRAYERAERQALAGLDEMFAQLGYQPLGDMVVLPLLADGIVRTFRADDGKAIAACVGTTDRVASTTFLALLEKGAVLVISDAFVLEKPKKRVFATSMSTATPAELEAKLRERRAALEQKYGAPVIMADELTSAAQAWEAWWGKQAG
jgi:hypothetical protein